MLITYIHPHDQEHLQRINVEPGAHVSIERTHDAQGHPVRWELKINGRLLPATIKTPFFVDGFDPFNASNGRFRDIPNYIHICDAQRHNPDRGCKFFAEPPLKIQTVETAEQV